MHKMKSSASSLSAMLLAVMLSGCASDSPKPPVSAALPALPEQARVSKIPIPSACLPSCLSGLTNERKQWADTLTGSGPQESPASAATTQ